MFVLLIQVERKNFMNKKYLLTLSTLVAVTTVMVTPASASAFEGFGHRNGQKHEGMMGKMEGEHRGKSFLSEEMRAQFREEHQNLSEEERAQMHEERRAGREENRAEMEEFTGMNREEMRAAHQDGQSIGDVLLENGKSEADAEDFLLERANERVDHVLEMHDLSETQETTLRERVSGFVERILGRWFGN